MRGPSIPGALWRALRAVGHVIRGLWIIWRQFDHITAQARVEHVRRWSQQMLAILGVQLVVKGNVPAKGPCLVVSNHISWLDILVLNAAQPLRFVSKADVRHWPVLGALVTGAGTLYIERERRRDAMRVVHHMAEGLKNGDLIAVFPEGTTGDGRELLPFHGNLIQAAIAVHAPILPVSLSFMDGRTGGHSDAPAYVGDDHLVGSVWRTLRDGAVQAVVHFGTAEYADGRDRRVWAHDLREVVASLREPRAAKS
ncbi:lysophospholipid acyltransferase family protein [Hydrogenophaga sp. 5NK40-0174]|uniref:lysophospholipid acyltransferase family protein n=1 Tax=Hydrogenophaga sp. 5NK40-0174 TaxID=3127649 RepID=UPI00310605E0